MPLPDWIHAATHGAALATAALAGGGLVQAAAGWRAVSRFRARPVPAAASLPPITVLKPLHGDEPLLEQALATFCAQDYPAFQIVFGLQDPADPALHVLRRLCARFPALDMAVVVDPTPHGANRKIANLLNMFPSARHDTLVIADSDIHAAPDYLRHLAAALDDPRCGLVTTLYAGLPATGRLPARLGAAYINHGFLPGALMARALGRQDCLGATMALSRATLESVGGLDALSAHLADDAVLGHLVAARGLEVRLAATIPATTVPEARMARLFHHELRWARTIRALAPVGFLLSAVQYPLAWALLAVALSGARPWSLAVLAGAWAGRAAIGRSLDRLLQRAGALPGGAGSPMWLVPIRDVLSVVVMLASYADNRVAWRGQTLRAKPKAILSPVGASFAPEEG
ncbi:MAG: bacteriohopanetetrol glucosamine biosynthesis glycosyltransferase HpnI [Janthinobacterium lividum]